MPPPMSAHGYDTLDLIKDDLTNEAIETLYDIVRRAQSSPDKSSRALFIAYEEVLEEHGLRPNDDAVFHRFLFRMQQNKRKDENLVQRFERVLRESFEINIDLDEDGEGIEVTTNLDAERNGAQAGLGRYSRRGSFDSFFDGTADKVPGTDYGDLPVRTRRGSHGHAPNGHGNKWSNRRTRSDTEAHSYQQAQRPSRPRVNGHAPRGSRSGSQQPNHRRNGSISSRGSLQIRRDGHASTSQDGDNDADDSEYTGRTTSLDLSKVQIPGVNAPFPDDNHDSSHQHQQYIQEPFRPSDTGLMDDATTFERQRLLKLTRDCLQTWHRYTQERRATRDDMEGMAIAFDRRILLTLGFEQIRDTVRARRSSQETDRFFIRLESRADKARDLFLLTKAFTHWAKLTDDQVQRTSVARRHILRTRFFNGWRDITAVNELKIQHFVLGKFLQQWRARTATIREASQSAVLKYENGLTRRTYNEWFFKYCSAGATAWRHDWIKRSILRKWLEIAKVMKERDQWATDRRDNIVLRKTFRDWRQRTATIHSQSPQADKFRRTALLTRALRNLHKQAQLVPLLRQFEAQKDSRLIRNILRGWHQQSQSLRQAHNVDQMRILRNAWTAWNDRLRIKVLEDRINDRLIVESLYKWTLASRVSLFQRIHDRQLKESTFLTWVTKTDQRSNTLDAAGRRFAHFKRIQLLRTCLHRMETVTAERRAELFAVLAQYQQKLKGRIFDALKERLHHFQQLNQWSADARFYVLGRRTLKTWSEATQHQRRNRRRDAYAQVRRTIKMNLVRRLFETWRNKASHIAVQNQRAADILENRVLQISGVLVHRWHDRTIILRQQNTQATNVYDFKLASRHFQVWSQRAQDFRTIENQAVALRQESIEIAATSALKKLGWRLWNIQRQEENAWALYERNFEKHVRAMIRFWFEQATEKLANRPMSPTPTSRSRGGRSHRDEDDELGGGPGDAGHDDEEGPSRAGDETQQLEPWTAFDETALGLNNDLDLSLSVTTDHRYTTITNPYTQLPPSSIRPTPHPLSSILRPNTYPQPHSALRPPKIPEDTQSDDDDDDLDFAPHSTFWSGTPLPPTGGKPGYLKTPSKRSVVRAKRPELPASPEKRVVSPVRQPFGLDPGRAGAMSAPPGQRNRDAVDAISAGMTSFETRLRRGGFGFGGSVAGSNGNALVRERGRGRGGKRVGFGAGAGAG